MGKFVADDYLVARKTEERLKNDYGNNNLHLWSLIPNDIIIVVEIFKEEEKKFEQKKLKEQKQFEKNKKKKGDKEVGWFPGDCCD
jgi:hypothetical protein